MKKKYTELFFSLVSTLICAGLFSSCGIITVNSPAKSEAATEESAEVTTSYEVSYHEPYKEDYSNDSYKFLKKIPQKDYGGSVFLITSAKDGVAAPSDNSGAVISAELLARNKAVEDYYNITVTTKTVEPEAMLTDISANVKSGTYYSDLIFIPQSYIYQFMVKGLLMNLSSMPNLNLGASYFYTSGVQAAGANNKTYAIAGPATLTEDAFSCIFYNKNLVSNAGLASPYDLVDSGEWTWEKFGEYLKSAQTIDCYSVGTQNAKIYLADLVYFSCGGRFTNSVAGGYPTIAMDTKFGEEIVSLTKSIFADPKYYGDSMTAIERFNSGELMFLIDNLSTSYTLANSKVDWGVLPLPKYNKEQVSYLSLANVEEAMFMGVVPTVTDTDKVSGVMSVLNIAAYGSMTDAYASNAMNYCLRDNASCRMYDKVLEMPVYDFAYTFSPYSESIASISYTAVRNPVDGFQTLTWYINAWGNSYNNAVYRLFK